MSERETPEPCGASVVTEVEPGQRFVLACNRVEGHDGDHAHWALGVAGWTRLNEGSVSSDD